MVQEFAETGRRSANFGMRCEIGLRYRIAMFEMLDSLTCRRDAYGDAEGPHGSAPKGTALHAPFLA